MSDKAAVASYSASVGTTVFGALTAHDWAAIAGICLGAATFAVNWYYKHQHLKLAKALSKPDEEE